MGTNRPENKKTSKTWDEATETWDESTQTWEASDTEGVNRPENESL